MKAVLVAVTTLFLMLAPRSATADHCRQRRVIVHSNASVVFSSGLTVVPFAVPVAVPVATVSQPTLFYGYGGYSSERGTRPAERGVNGLHAPTSDQRVPDSESKAPTGVPSDSKAVDILRRHCSACHTAEASHGGLQIFWSSGRIFDKLPRHVILEMVSPDAEGIREMPPGDRPKLSPEDVETIRQWAKLPRNAVY